MPRSLNASWPPSCIWRFSAGAPIASESPFSIAAMAAAPYSACSFTVFRYQPVCPCHDVSCQRWRAAPQWRYKPPRMPPRLSCPCRKLNSDSRPAPIQFTTGTAHSSSVRSNRMFYVYFQLPMWVQTPVSFARGPPSWMHLRANMCARSTERCLSRVTRLLIFLPVIEMPPRNSRGWTRWAGRGDLSRRDKT
jgi:hypothetical protein